MPLGYVGRLREFIRDPLSQAVSELVPFGRVDRVLFYPAIFPEYPPARILGFHCYGSEALGRPQAEELARPRARDNSQATLLHGITDSKPASRAGPLRSLQVRRRPLGRRLDQGQQQRQLGMGLTLGPDKINPAPAARHRLSRALDADGIPGCVTPHERDQALQVLLLAGARGTGNVTGTALALRHVTDLAEFPLLPALRTDLRRQRLRKTVILRAQVSHGAGLIAGQPQQAYPRDVQALPLA